jgi:hypothetical protein
MVLTAARIAACGAPADRPMATTPPLAGAAAAVAPR